MRRARSSLETKPGYALKCGSALIDFRTAKVGEMVACVLARPDGPQREGGLRYFARIERPRLSTYTGASSALFLQLA
jgi:hypothetical protein